MHAMAYSTQVMTIAESCGKIPPFLIAPRSPSEVKSLKSGCISVDHSSPDHPTTKSG